MIHPKRDSLIALIVTLACLLVFGWGLSRLRYLGESDVPGGIAIALGGLVGFFGLLMLLNLRWSARIARRMERGEGIIARWTVPADTIAAYLAAEATRPWQARSSWRPKPGAAAEVLFSEDAILAGGRYHGLKAKGLQVFSVVRLVQSTPPVIEFLIQEITTSSAHNYAAGKFDLRIPIPPGAEPPAALVLEHFRKVRAGDAVADTRFWRLRQRIGLAIFLLSALAGAAGYGLAERSDWRVDDTMGIVVVTLMLVGLLFGTAGLFLAAVATGALRRAARQGIRPAR